MKKLFILTSSILTSFCAVASTSCCQANNVVVTLYAGDVGAFNGSKTLFLTNVNRGAVLKDITNYAEPESDYDFLGWVDDNGNEVKPDAAINSSMFLRANYSIPNPNNFETDPWSTVIYYANQGLDALCSAYNCEPNYFVGKKRKLNINNLDHSVMVVGTNNEQYEQDGTSHMAALTFQFFNCVSAQQTDSLQIEFDNRSTDEFEYWSSTLWNALNGTNVNWSDVTVRKSVAEMIKDGEPLVYKNIKEVYRSVNSLEKPYRDYYRWHLDTRKTMIFEPSLANYFSDAGIKETGFGEGTAFKTEEAMLRCMAEGNQYQYFAQEGNIGDEKIIISFEVPECYKCITRYTISDIPCSYHLSSPYTDERNQVWYIQELIFDQCFVDTEQYVAPCFCI